MYRMSRKDNKRMLKCQKIDELSMERLSELLRDPNENMHNIKNTLDII